MVDRNQTKKKQQAAAKKRRRQPKGAAHAGEFVSSGTQKLHNIFAHSANALQRRAISNPDESLEEEAARKRAEASEKSKQAKEKIKGKVTSQQEEIKKTQKELQKEKQASEALRKNVKHWSKKQREQEKRTGQKYPYDNPHEEEASEIDWEQIQRLLQNLEDERTGPAGVEGGSAPGGGERRQGRRKSGSVWPPDSAEQHAHMVAQDLLNQRVSPDLAYRTAAAEAKVRTGKDPDMRQVRERLQGPQTTVSTTPSDRQRVIDDQTGDWWTKAQSPDRKRAKTGVRPDASRRKRGKPRDQQEMMSPEEREWLRELQQTEGSPYYQSTGRGGIEKNKANLRIYAALREEGYSPEESHAEVMNPQRVQGRKTGAFATGRTKTEAQSAATERVQQTIRPKPTGVRDKYKKSGGSHEDFAASVRVPGVDLEQIKKDFPDWSDEQLVQYERQHREDTNDWLEKNERWAHEQRVANVLGRPDTGENKDRVVFFTTNVGSPAASVPANSLIGQYIIKKRKKMVVDEKNAVRSEVKGEFPRAVRDQHLIEVSTGVSLGAQGRYGAFHTTGYKAGKKRSKGYGKQVPVGTQVLRDKNNQPVYDKNGNLRYTEGYTRPFTLTTDRDVGLRIFVG